MIKKGVVMKNTRALIIGTIFCAVFFNTSNIVSATNPQTLSCHNQDAQIPELINYQAKLVDSTGQPVVDGGYVMVFSLYTDTTSRRQPIWSETQIVQTRNGLFNVFLNIPPGNLSSNSCYLGIRVLPSEKEMLPLQRIVSVPFAYFAHSAGEAQRVSGYNITGLDGRYVNENQTNSITSPMIVDSTITSADIASGFLLLNTSLMGGDVIQSGSSIDTVINSEVTTGCLIFLTIGPTRDSVKPIKVYSIANGRFVVGTIDNQPTLAPIPFQYLIIKPNP